MPAAWPMSVPAVLRLFRRPAVKLLICEPLYPLRRHGCSSRGRSCRFRDAHALDDDRRRSPLRARRSASGSPMRLLMRAEAGNEPASGERVYLQLPACSPSRRRQRLLVRLWGQLLRPCRVLGAATDSWSLQRWCSAAMTRCGRARLAAGATEIVSTPRLVGIRTLCRSSRFSGSGPSGSGVNMPQAHNVGR
jgi:hypothetical protein